MGLFDKKLDYSSGNGSLPWVNESDYYPLRLPSSTEVSAPNFNYIEKEKKQGKYGYFLELVFRNYQNNEENADVIKLVEKYLSTLKNVLAPDMKPDAIQNLGRYIAVGISFAKVENESKLQLPEKMHPYLSNSFFSLFMDISRDSDTKNIFNGIEHYAHILELAIKIGYLAQRYEGKMSVQEMFTNIRPLS